MTAIAATRKRYPDSSVEYVVADLFAPLAEWPRAFDFVLEVYTVQAFTGDLRARAIKKIAETVAPGGHLLVIARGRDESDDPGAMPWPLLRSELDPLPLLGLRELAFEDYYDEEEPPVRRFRATFQR